MYSLHFCLQVNNCGLILCVSFILCHHKTYTEIGLSKRINEGRITWAGKGPLSVWEQEGDLIKGRLMSNQQQGGWTDGTYVAGGGRDCQFSRSYRLQLQHYSGKCREDEAKHRKQMPKPKLGGKDSRRNHGKSHLIMADGNWLAGNLL